MTLKSLMITIRILATATAVGLVAFSVLAHAPPEWFKWLLIAMGAMLLGMVVIQNRRSFAELRRREWLRLFDRTQRAEAPSPEPDSRGNVAEDQSNEHVTELASKRAAIMTEADDAGARGVQRSDQITSAK